MSEMTPCAGFMFNVSIESAAKVFNCPGWDLLFAVMYDCDVKIFNVCIFVSVVVYVEVC